LEYKLTHKKISGGNHRFFKPATVKEVIQFWGIWILLMMEYSQLNGSLQINFKMLKKDHKFSMTFNRFKAFHSSLICETSDLDSVVDLLCASFQRVWSPGTVVAFDESSFIFVVLFLILLV